jgi:phosphohistidine swiveling domain-containing protein
MFDLVLNDWYVNKEILDNLFINSIADKKFNYRKYVNCQYPDMLIIYKKDKSLVRLINKKHCFKAKKYFSENKSTLNKNLKILENIIFQIKFEITELNTKKTISNLIFLLRKFDFYYRIIFYENSVRKNINNKLYIKIKTVNYNKYVSDILSKISDYLKISVESLNYLTINEIDKLIKNKFSLIYLKKEIIKRNKGYIYYIKGKKDIFIYNKKDIFNLSNQIETNNIDTNLKGIVTSKINLKKIIGKVMVLRNNKDYYKIRSKNLKNIILVLIKLDLEIIPWVRKVKAIIADQGTILSHASIISREENIPCVVKTDYATKILKDNDVVEIDLETGLITKTIPF